MHLFPQGSSYAIGNTSFHNGELYAKLKPAIPLLIRLLEDPIAKTRANAASKKASVCHSASNSKHQCHLVNDSTFDAATCHVSLPIGALGNLAIHSGELCSHLIQHKAPHRSVVLRDEQFLQSHWKLMQHHPAVPHCQCHVLQCTGGSLSRQSVWGAGVCPDSTALHVPARETQAGTKNRLL